jgi:hypothetical protein
MLSFGIERRIQRISISLYHIHIQLHVILLFSITYDLQPSEFRASLVTRTLVRRSNHPAQQT